MGIFRRIWMAAGVVLIAQSVYAQTVELRAAAELSMPPGTTASVVVSGTITGEFAAAVSINVQITPIGSPTGTVTFTPAAISTEWDILQLGDPWPGRGASTFFDTAATLSDTTNGFLTDNGNVADPGPLTFAGQLVGFPVVASADASGSWNVILLVSSQWEFDGVNLIPATTLFNGTIVVSGAACNADVDCDDANDCTNDSCTAGVCSNVNNTLLCDDSDACTTGDVCGAGTCAGVDTSAADCDDGNVCTTDTCDSVAGCANANNTVSCDDGNACTTSDTCSAGACAGVDTSAVDCNDSNVCTTDTCDTGTGCVNTNNTIACDDSNQCTDSDVCAGGSCSGSSIDCSGFDDQCNTASCDLVNPVSNCDTLTPVADATVCDDAVPCTDGDVCTAGTCAGSTIAGCELCVINADCADDFDPCTDDLCIGGTCQYPLNDTCPTLRLNADQVCYDLGLNSTVTVGVDMVGMAGLDVVAGQFFVDFDTTRLSFVSAVPGDAPFLFELFEGVIGSEIDYAVFANFGDPGTSADTTMARITFQATQECAPFLQFRPFLPGSESNVSTFGDLNPTNPILVDMGAIMIDQTAPVVTIPSDINVHSDAGACGAVVTWTPPTATDNCLGSVPVSCTSAPTTGLGNGSVFPVGTTTMTCVATDSCGNNSTEFFDVTVSGSNELFVDVQLSGVHELFLTRCLTFEFSNCGTGQPVEVVTKEISFIRDPGDAAADMEVIGASVLVACGAYDCLTARDHLHTLRRTALDFTDDGTTYSASFTGDPVLSGGSLVGGDLNDSGYIDIVDFAAFTGSFGLSVGANTNCATVAPHADISGNGSVGTEDFSFISIGFGESSDLDCCAPGGAAGVQGHGFADGPIMRLSIREAREVGIRHPELADLNNDGWIDQRDIVAFLEFGPSSLPPALKSGVRHRGQR